jgi:parallel beta-helix repeat protein
LAIVELLKRKNLKKKKRGGFHMETKILNTLLVVSLLVLGMFVGLISFDDDDNSITYNAKADTLFVYPGGESSGNYSSIQNAIDNASEGDTIRVFEGMYFENVIVNKSVNLIGNLTFGAGSNMTVINASFSGDGLYISADNVTIKGFVLAFSGFGFNDSGIELNNVENCSITGNALMLNNYGIWLNETENCTIKNNYFMENSVGMGIYTSTNDTYMSNYFDNSSSYDVLLVTGDITLVNCSINSSKLGLVGPGSIDVQFYHYIVVIGTDDPEGGPGVYNATVIVKENGTGKKVFEGKTNYQGFIIEAPLTAYIYDGSFNYSMQNMNFTASKKGYVNGTNITNASIDARVIFVLMTDNSTPVVTNLVMDPSENVSVNNPCYVMATINDTGDSMVMFIGLIYTGSNQTLDNYTDLVMIRDGIDVSQRSENIYDVNFTWNATSPYIWDEGMGGYLNNGTNETYMLADHWEDNGTNYTGVSVYYSNSSYNMNAANLEYYTDNGTLRGLWNDDQGEWLEPYQFALAGGNVTARVEVVSLFKNTNILAAPPGDTYQPYGPAYNLTDADFRVEPLVPDGEYKAGIVAVDYSWNIGFNMTNITVDNTLPTIVLNSPADGSVVTPGTVFDLSVSDTNLKNVSYQLNSGPVFPLLAPFDIFTSVLADNNYDLMVWANDSANNLEVETFGFTIDSMRPEIVLNDPLNNAFIYSGTIIDLSIIDANIDYVNYTVNGASNTTITAPYDIDTTSWSDGSYDITVFTFDLAANNNQSTFSFTLDSTLPTINLISPSNGSVILPGTNISLTINDENFDTANFSLDSGIDQTLTSPFNITTDTWSEGNHSIMVNAKDLAGNTVYKIYNFTIDTISPVINLVSPTNNSLIKPGTFLKFDIIDNNTNTVNYTIDGGSYVTFPEPYNLSTIGWDDGTHSIEIQVTDLAGHSVYGYYSFEIDGTVPEIMLNTPSNNSVIMAGTDIDFDITEINQDTATYSVNGGTDKSFTSPYDIDTTGWMDGLYSINVFVSDLVGHVTRKVFDFVIDSTKPKIELISPEDDAIIKAGTVISFNITDNNTETVNYTYTGSTTDDLTEPYNIRTDLWLDGEYAVNITVLDKAGNYESNSFTFTIDSANPIISIISPDTSEFTNDTVIDLSITDANLDTVSYTLDGANQQTLNTPFEISTADWDVGEHELEITAVDKAGNSATRKYTFTILPILVEKLEVINVMPEPEAKNVKFDAKIIIEFNLSMNTSSVENAISILPSIEISNYKWNVGNTKVTITFSSELEGNTKYSVSVSTLAKTEANTVLSESYSWSFTTERDTDGDNIPDSEDTDDDGDEMTDEWEIQYQLDPFNPNDANIDSDGDTLFNLAEFQNQTNPNLEDTDGDGLSDSDEIILHSTNPLIDDSDGDGFKDGDEILAGSNPNDTNSIPEKEEKPDDKDESDGLFGLGKVGGIDLAVILIIIIIVIILLLAVLLRRKSPEPEERESEEEEIDEDELSGEEFECPECGTMVEAGEVECPECGADVELDEDEIEEDEDVEDMPEEDEEPVQEEEPISEEPVDEEELEDDNPDEESEDIESEDSESDEDEIDEE